MPTYTPQDENGQAAGTNLAPAGGRDTGGTARAFFLEAFGSFWRLLTKASLSSADGSKDVTVTTDGLQERLDVSAAIDTPLPAGTNTIGKVHITDGGEDAEVLPVGTKNALSVVNHDSAGHIAVNSVFGEQIAHARSPAVQTRFGFGSIPFIVNPVITWTLSGETGGTLAAGDLVRGLTSGAIGVIVEKSPFRLKERGLVRFQSGEIIESAVAGTITATITAGAFGTVTRTTSNLLKVEAGTNASHIIRAESAEPVIYHAGQEGYAIFTAAWPDGGIAGVTQFAGLLREDEGIYVGYSGTNFVFGYRNAAGGDEVAKASFTYDQLDGTGRESFTIDTTKLNIFMVAYGYLGTAPLTLYVLSDTGIWILVHVFDLPNTQAVATFKTPVFPVCIEIEKTAAGAVTPEMLSGSWQGGHVGPLIDSPHTNTIGATKTISTEEVIAAVRCKWTVESVDQVADLFINAISASTDGNKNVIFRLRKNPKLSGALTWADVSANSSIAQTATDNVTYTSGGRLLRRFSLSKVDATILELDREDRFVAQPGDYIVLTAESASTNEVRASFSWIEETT